MIQRVDPLGTGQHISGRFNDELESIKNLLLEMGGMVENQIGLTAEALVGGEHDAAEQVINIDREINRLEVEIDEQCARIIALRQPAAFDLRLVMSIAKVTTDLERIGDEATRVAKIAINTLDSDKVVVAASPITHVARQVSSMLRQSLDAFARLNADAASEILLADRGAEGHYASGIDELMRAIRGDVTRLDFYMDRIWALRSLHRVGAHAVNIAEQVVYLVTGVDVRHTDEEGLRRLLQ